MVPCSFLDDNVNAKHCQILMGRRRKENKVNVENVFKSTRRMRQKGNWLYLNPSTGFVYQKVRGVFNKAFGGGTDCNTVNSRCNGHHRDQDWVSVIEKSVIAGVVFSDFLFLGTSAAVRNDGVSVTARRLQGES